jgi:hypothetical protein
MNPLVAAILPTIINLVEHLIDAEGPAVIDFLKKELASLESKYK